MHKIVFYYKKHLFKGVITMSMSYDTNINDFEVNMFEYCTLVKDLKMPGSKTAYVKVHKLMPYCNKGDKSSSD